MAHNIHHDRIRTRNDHEYERGPIVYWMSRDMRVHDNWALLHAQNVAEMHDVPLYVCYNLEIGFEGGAYRQHHFKIESLRRIKDMLETYGIPLFVISGTDTHNEVLTLLRTIECGAVVTDFSPLRTPQMWVDAVARSIDVPLYEVDAHNIVPVWRVSEKREYAARTIRPKLHKLLPEFLTPYPSLTKQTYPEHTISDTYAQPDWDALLERPSFEYDVPAIDWCTPGERAAKIHLTKFIHDRFDRYADQRNDPHADAQSNLSPYLHYGNISAQRIARDIVEHVGIPIDKILHHERNGAGTKNNASAFLEELIIRRELSDNFCYYTKHYDTTSAFPEWAQKTLMTASSDEREYVYDLETLRTAQTHDALWNAAQYEMVSTGKMHGYMRMYWAKKILQWTENPDIAMRYAIILNDTYELDGRDPNGYAGIAWSIGGVHDRPWFTRPIFGTIRYMARSGCEKKFDVEAYIAKHTPSLFNF